MVACKRLVWPVGDGVADSNRDHSFSGSTQVGRCPVEGLTFSDEDYAFPQAVFDNKFCVAADPNDLGVYQAVLLFRHCCRRCCYRRYGRRRLFNHFHRFRGCRLPRPCLLGSDLLGLWKTNFNTTNRALYGTPRRGEAVEGGSYNSPLTRNFFERKGEAMPHLTHQSEIGEDDFIASLRFLLGILDQDEPVSPYSIKDCVECLLDKFACHFGRGFFRRFAFHSLLCARG